MLKQLQDQLFQLDTPFLGLPLSVYVVTGAQTVLIDSGISTTPSQFIIPALDAAGLEPDLLICTHGHVDHLGGISALRQRYPKMKVALQQDDALWAEDHERHLSEMYMCMPQTWQAPDAKGFLELCGENSAVDLYLQDGQELDFGSYRFSLIQTRGHSPGHLTLHDATRQLVICGDVALGWGALAAGAPKINPYYYDVDLYRHGIETVLSLEGALYCTGHSGSLDDAGMRTLGAHSLEFVNALDVWTYAALDTSQPLSLGAIARQVLGSLSGYECGFHLHASVQAHLTRFAREGGARVVMVGGLKHYLRVA